MHNVKATVLYHDEARDKESGGNFRQARAMRLKLPSSFAGALPQK